MTDSGIVYEVEGGAGNDVITLGAGHGTVKGGEGDDIITGSDGDDIICGEGGADRIDAKDGNDLIFADKGKISEDGLTISANASLTGGNDFVIGGGGNDLHRRRRRQRPHRRRPGSDLRRRDTDPAGNDIIFGDGVTITLAAPGRITSTSSRSRTPRAARAATT